MNNIFITLQELYADENWLDTQDILVDTNKKWIYSMIKKENKIQLNFLTKEEQQEINCNCNTYSIKDVRLILESVKDEKLIYLNPTLETFFIVFKNGIHSIVESVYPYYDKMFSDKNDVISICYEVILKLYKKGYYLHKQLIKNSLRNELSKMIRNKKGYKIYSLDYNYDEAKSSMLDFLTDDDIEEKIADEDYATFLFNEIKNAIIEETSQLMFDRLMIQLETKTLTSDTSKLLMKIRNKMGSDYVPRPNSKGKKRGKRK